MLPRFERPGDPADGNSGDGCRRRRRARRRPAGSVHQSPRRPEQVLVVGAGQPHLGSAGPRRDAARRAVDQAQAPGPQCCHFLTRNVRAPTTASTGSTAPTGPSATTSAGAPTSAPTAWSSTATGSPPPALRRAPPGGQRRLERRGRLRAVLPGPAASRSADPGGVDRRRRHARLRRVGSGRRRTEAHAVEAASTTSTATPVDRHRERLPSPS